MAKAATHHSSSSILATLRKASIFSRSSATSHHPNQNHVLSPNLLSSEASASAALLVRTVIKAANFYPFFSTA